MQTGLVQEPASQMSSTGEAGEPHGEGKYKVIQEGEVSSLTQQQQQQQQQLHHQQ